MATAAHLDRLSRRVARRMAALRRAEVVEQAAQQRRRAADKAFGVALQAWKIASFGETAEASAPRGEPVKEPGKHA